MESRSDTELLAGALAGDGEAFGAFYRRHVRRIAAFHLARCRAAQDAADLTAETFAVALEALDRFDPERGEAIAWLFGIARHRNVGHHRRGAVEDRARRKLGMPPLELSDEDVSGIEARFLEDASYEDIARRLRCSEAVVRKRVSRGLQTVRRRMVRQRMGGQG